VDLREDTPTKTTLGLIKQYNMSKLNMAVSSEFFIKEKYDT